jgi:hypothetical protein
VHVVVTVTQLCPPLEVAVYPVIGEPPSTAGALHETTDLASSPVVATTDVGSSGFDTTTTMSGSSVIGTVIVPSLVAVPTNVETPARTL